MLQTSRLTCIVCIITNSHLGTVKVFGWHKSHPRCESRFGFPAFQPGDSEFDGSNFEIMFNLSLTFHWQTEDDDWTRNTLQLTFTAIDIDCIWLPTDSFAAPCPAAWCSSSWSMVATSIKPLAMSYSNKGLAEGDLAAMFSDLPNSE